MPSITHLLPVRNGEKFILDILETIKKNAEKGDEILVIDDGSQDRTPHLIETFTNTYPDIRVIRTEGLGLVRALNLGFQESAGSWVARYDADDRYPQDRIAKQRELIANDVAVIFSDYSLWINGDKYAGIIVSPIFSNATLLSLLTSQQTAHPSALINKVHFEKSGGYSETEFPAEDLGLWLRLSRTGKLISIPEELLYYSMTSSGISNTNRRKVQDRTLALRDKNIENVSDLLDLSILHYEFNSYKGFTNQTDRKILLLRNLKVLQDLNPKISTEKANYAFPNLYFFSLMHPIISLRLLYYRNMRNRFRR